MSGLDAQATSTRVRQQYEYLPYPTRNPAEERQRLLLTGLDDLNAVNHYCYHGRRNVQKNFRVLIAGGGTGDSVVFLAHQLRQSKCELVYIDLSEASQSIARRRLQARGLEHRVHWIHGSLLDLPQMGLGRFDYINCSGVLHHLADPNAGLKCLRDVLADDGALGLMVYGEYGRTGVYQMQSLFRIIGEPRLEMGQQVDEVRSLLGKLPPTNWFRRGAEMFCPLHEVGNSELLDLFLHTQDRAYTVPQLYDFLGSAGLQLAEWSAESRVWYQPHIAFQDPELLARIQLLPRRDQEAACELFWGSLIKHCVWATPGVDTAAQWSDEGMIPTWSRTASVFKVRDGIINSPTNSWQLDLPKGGGTKIQVCLTVDDIARRFVQLADGMRTVETIVTDLARQFTGHSRNDLDFACQEIFRLLNANDLLLLRHRSLPQIPE